MATYIPNAEDLTQPTEDKQVVSAALEFRTLKTSVSSKISALQSADVGLDSRVTAVETALLTAEAGGLPGTVYVQQFSGTGSQTVFTLAVGSASENAVDIYINGVYQQKTTFSITGTTLTFSEAPPLGTDNIEVQVTVTAALGIISANFVNYIPAGTGAVATNVETKLREVVSVKDFGAVGDGSTDDTDAIKDTFAYCGSIGQKAYVPAGTYSIHDTVLWPIERGFEVECAAGAVFKAADILPVDSKMFMPSAVSGNQRFVWRGGVIDGRLMPAKGTGAPDLLYIASQYIKNVDIEGVTFICNDTRDGTASDSCLFLAEGEDYRVVGNIFQGATDAGVYVSGDPDAIRGRRVIAANNTFIECHDVGFITKRSFENHIVTNNFFKNCGAGIVLGGAADLQTSAFKGIITNNLTTNCLVGISVRICDGIVISGNRIEDFGYDSTGAATATGGIQIEGASSCIINGNNITIASTAPVHANSTGIWLKDRTELSVTYSSEYNFVAGNVVNGCGRGIVEDASSNFTMIGENYITNTTGTTLSLSGSNSQFGPVITNSVAYRIGGSGSPSLEVTKVENAINYITAAGSAGTTAVLGTAGTSTDVNLALAPKGAGVILLGGAAGGEALRVSKGVTSGNALQVNGAASGAYPALVSRGADTNIDLALVPKGSGSIRFGTLIASADTPITGYIEVKDISGNIRKLAVIA